jgi:hypothetical protein
MNATIPNARIIPDVVRDAKNVLNDSPCIFCAFSAALSSTLLILLLISSERDCKHSRNQNDDNRGNFWESIRLIIKTCAESYKGSGVVSIPPLKDY